VDYADYLPWDRRPDISRALAWLRPSAVVFSKLDLWPELATRAAASGARVGIIGASVSERSRRLRWPARMLSRAGYRAVERAGAVSEADAARLERLGVPQDRIEITGDPRFDSALARARGPSRDDPTLLPLRGDQALIAGSTWPADEELLLQAFAVVQRFTPEAKLVLVPHEPTEARITQIENAAERRGLRAIRWSAAPGVGRLIVVDQVGLLAGLYAGARVAYVGGGLGRAGLHSVLEPAACGAAVLFGPGGRHHPDAARLIHLRAAAVVDPEFPAWLDLDNETTHADSNPLAALWLALLRHPTHARDAGRRGRAYVEAGAGAARLNANLVERLMKQGSEVRGPGSGPLTAPE
jgi:3-deoxy-D-manno-octulosonic-acid transferase